MGKVETTHGSTGGHGIIFGEMNVDIFFGLQQIKKGPFFRMFGAGGITRRRANSLLFFADHRENVEALLFGISPEFLAYTFVQQLGKGFSQ